MTDDALEAELRELFAHAEQRLRTAAGLPAIPCLFTMALDEHRREWCRIGGDIPHRVHVSMNGVYRWDDKGRLHRTPHIDSPDFAAYYAAHPDGQADWIPPDPPTPPRTDPSLFAILRNRWNSFADLPPLERRARRAGVVSGFAVALLAFAAIGTAAIGLAGFFLWAIWTSLTP